MLALIDSDLAMQKINLAQKLALFSEHFHYFVGPFFAPGFADGLRRLVAETKLSQALRLVLAMWATTRIFRAWSS